jgi:hypothetical protein
MNRLKRLYQEFMTFGETVKDRKYTPAQFTAVVRKFIGTPDIMVKTHKDANVDKNQIVIAGCYDPEEDELNFASITIYVTYNPIQKKIYARDIDWQQLCIDILEVSGHESVHQRQYRFRGFESAPSMFISLTEDEQRRFEQEYLGNEDEIEAYGYSIATEVFLKTSPRRITTKHISKSAMFKAYINAFGYDHKVTGMLLAYILKYYNSHIGSPCVKKSMQIV